MLFRKPFYEERIADGTREWNVDNPSVMHVANFRVGESKLTPSKTMWVGGDLGPRGDRVFEHLQ